MVTVVYEEMYGQGMDSVSEPVVRAESSPGIDMEPLLPSGRGTWPPPRFKPLFWADCMAFQDEYGRLVEHVCVMLVTVASQTSFLPTATALITRLLLWGRLLIGVCCVSEQSLNAHHVLRSSLL